MEFARARSQSGQRNRHVRLPAVAQQVGRMGRDADGFESPVREPVKRADPETPESRRVGAFGCAETPFKIPLRTGGVHLRVNLAVVGFLVNHQPVRSRRDQRPVIRRVHRPDLERNAGPFRVQCGDAFPKIPVGNKLGMLARHQQEVAESLGLERAGFPQHLVHGQRHPKNRIVAREAAILAVVDALVGKIQRREQADDFAEALLGERVRAAAHGFQQFARGRRNQRGEIAQGNSRFGDRLARGGGIGGARLFDQRVQRQRTRRQSSRVEPTRPAGNVERSNVAIVLTRQELTMFRKGSAQCRGQFILERLELAINLRAFRIRVGGFRRIGFHKPVRDFLD